VDYKLSGDELSRLMQMPQCDVGSPQPIVFASDSLLILSYLLASDDDLIPRV
jgi:hypothetical protein